MWCTVAGGLWAGLCGWWVSVGRVASLIFLPAVFSVLGGRVWLMGLGILVVGSCIGAVRFRGGIFCVAGAIYFCVFLGCWGGRVNQVCYARYHFSFYLWLIIYVLKHFIVPKYYDQDCLKIFFLLSTLPIMIQISGKNSDLVQKS